MKARLTLTYEMDTDDDHKRFLEAIHNDWKQEEDYHKRVKICDDLEVNFETFYVGPVDIKLEFSDE